MTHRLRPRQIARQINHKRTLPQRLWREVRWLLRDLHDVRDELRRFTDVRVGPRRGFQSEMTEKDVARDGF